MQWRSPLHPRRFLDSLPTPYQHNTTIDMSATPEHKPASPDAHLDGDDAKPAIPDAADAAPLAEDNDAAPATAAEDADAEAAVADERDDLGDGLSDDDSVLSEVDEAQFEDFDPANIDVEEERPQLAIDEENLKLVGRHKRKRSEGGDEGDRPRRKKEGRREKKTRRMKELEEGGEREPVRRKERKRREATPEDDQTLDPATRMSCVWAPVCWRCAD